MTTSLSVNDTNTDVKVKVTVVKLMGQDQEDVEVAWGEVEEKAITAAYERPEARPTGKFQVKLSNADAVASTLTVKFQFSKELLEEKKEAAEAGDLVAKGRAANKESTKEPADAEEKKEPAGDRAHSPDLPR